MEKKIDGWTLSKKILVKLKKKNKRIKKKGVTPTLAIFSVDHDPASASFIRAKRKAAQAIGAELRQFKFKKNTSYQAFAERLNQAARDPKFSGIIIQRPLPVNLASSSLNLIIPLKKDIDGFRQKSSFMPPVAMAVLRALDWVRTGGGLREEFPSESLINWLSHHSILLIGRGETAGEPIARELNKRRVKFLITHQGTENLSRFVKKADIVIACVGKERIVKAKTLKEGAILIGVGIKRTKKSKFRGDFDEQEIKDAVSFYTPTPGGIGPLTVASLMENLVSAADEKG